MRGSTSGLFLQFRRIPDFNDDPLELHRNDLDAVGSMASRYECGLRDQEPAKSEKRHRSTSFDGANSGTDSTFGRGFDPIELSELAFVDDCAARHQSLDSGSLSIHEPLEEDLETLRQSTK